LSGSGLSSKSTRTIIAGGTSSLAAGFLARVAFPLRRYALTMTNEPVFFSAVLAGVPLLGAMPVTFWGRADKRWVWHPRVFCIFFGRGFSKRLALC